MTMHRIACNFPPARRAAYAISMSHDQRPLVLAQDATPWATRKPVRDFRRNGPLLTLRQVRGEDLMSSLPKHKVGDKDSRFLNPRISVDIAARRCDPAAPDHCSSVSIRVHPCQMITRISSGRSSAWNGERWPSNTDGHGWTRIGTDGNSSRRLRAAYPPSSASSAFDFFNAEDAEVRGGTPGIS